MPTSEVLEDVTPRGVSWPAAFIVAGFVSAGSFKGTDVVSRLPVDLTVLLAGLTLLLVIRRSAHRVPSDVLKVAFGFLLLAVPVLWTTGSGYGDQKISRLFTLTLLAGIAPVMLVRTHADVRRLIWASTALSAASVVGVLVAPQSSSDYAGAPVVALGDNTISTASGAGFVIIVMGLAVMWRRVPWPLGVPIIGAAAYAVLQTGSRGPLLATVGAVVIAAVLARDRPALTRAALFVGLAAVLVTELFALAPSASQQRVLAVVHGNVTGDTQTRVQLFHQAWHSVVMTPAGLGWGGFQRLNTLGYRYPHNLPLEVLSEAGLVFGGLFLLWLGVHYVRIRNLRAGFTGSVTFAVLTSSLLESFVSGDLNDAKTLFFALAMGIALTTLGEEPIDASPVGLAPLVEEVLHPQAQPS